MATVTLSSINSGDIESLAAQEPGWLTSIRKQAFMQYESLPSEVSPLYSKYSDVNKIKPENIHLMAQSTRPPALSKDLSDRLKELDQETGILQLGQDINKVFIKDSMARQGIILCSIKDALTNHGDLIQSHMTTNQPNYLEDKFLALEGSAFQSGIFIYIPDRKSVV